jgi:hypothetical protein
MRSGRKEQKMDEPVKVKYVPLKEVEEIIKKHYWLTEDFYEMAERRGIDVVEYKCLVTISDQDASMFNGYTNFTVEEFAKKRASEWLSECVDRHIKCVDKERCPMFRSTEYRYNIMIGEIPKWKQKGEEE